MNVVLPQRAWRQARTRSNRGKPGASFRWSKKLRTLCARVIIDGDTDKPIESECLAPLRAVVPPDVSDDHEPSGQGGNAEVRSLWKARSGGLQGAL